MSPRAAWRLEALGFTAVYDYTPGEADWFAYDLGMEGAGANLPRAGNVARRDVPRCSPSDRIGDVRQQASGWEVCVVVNESDVVMGLVRQRELQMDADTIVEHVMRLGPATYRPDALVSDVLERLRGRGVSGVLVTRSNGTLIGWLRREDAEHSL